MNEKIKKLTELYGNEPMPKRFIAANVALDNKFFDQAIRWFEKLADQKEDLDVREKSMEELVKIWLKVESHTNYEKAREIFTKARDEKYVHLTFLYAHYIFHGDGPYIKDYDIGQEMLERARRLGSVDACNELGYLYCQGHEGISKNYGKGMDCFKEAAEMGNVEGIFNLATCYFNKEEQFYDFSLAKLWYARAAGKGDKLSIMMLDKIEKEYATLKTNRHMQ